MKRPIFPIVENVIVPKANHLASPKVTYLVPYAEKQLINTVKGSIVIQHYSYYLYYMEMVELTIKKEITVPFKVLCRSLFLFYILEGRVLFEDNKGETLSDTLANRCYATINEEADYVAKFSPGKHIFLYFSLRMDWISSESRLFPRLRDFITYHQQQRENAVSYMDKIFLNRTMIKTLMRVWRASPLPQDDFEQSLTSHVKQLLKAYDRAQDYQLYLMGLSAKEKIQEIKTFLCDNFHYDYITDIPSLCERFIMTERTLRRIFQENELGSPVTFINDLRLGHGAKLLLETRSKIIHISERCGFSSSNYFCRLFRRKYGHSPEEFRRLLSNK